MSETQKEKAAAMHEATDIGTKLTEARIAPSLAEAQTGDLLWLHEPEESRYINGKYQGRGTKRLFPVRRERASFVIGSMKFDFVFGRLRGQKIGYPVTVMGQKEYREAAWTGRAYSIAKLVEGMDADRLERIAEIVGYEMNDEGLRFLQENQT